MLTVFNQQYHDFFCPGRQDLRCHRSIAAIRSLQAQCRLYGSSQQDKQQSAGSKEKAITTKIPEFSTQLKRCQKFQ